MKSSDIYVLKSINPVTVIDKPSKSTTEFLAQLCSNPEFNNTIRLTRKMFKLPANGIDINQCIGKNFETRGLLDEMVLYILTISLQELQKKIGLDESFIDQLYLITFYNACMDVKYITGFISQPIISIPGRKNIASTIVDYPREVCAILLPYSVSQRSLIRWIKANWKTLSDQMNEHLLDDPYLKRVHKNSDIISEIIDLHDNFNKTYSEIAVIMADKYPNYKAYSGEDYVRKMYLYFKKVWKTFSEQSKKDRTN
jgi:hypothetical protein